MGSIFSSEQNETRQSIAKFVPMVCEYDVKTLRKMTIDIHLPPVLSNIVLQYVSLVLFTVEYIYDDTDQLWDFKQETQFMCSLSKSYKSCKSCNFTGVRVVHTLENGRAEVEIIFHQITVEGISAPKVCSTQLQFSCIDGHSYSLDTVSSGSVQLSQYLEFLDDGIREFQAPALRNIKSLIDSCASLRKSG